ncbi:DNA-directed RNA polymerase subunit delta [Mesoplasma lactucae]|uniref:RNAP delta factor n=1 Tax=Mesoplasma lactucae ATCC 49193 TaxID=81460 RepID=A0A291ISR7_9MOLU|nr:DNA-directed RNA polymerase subunit delta [Mesoplasma lactucae]ATG97741.1 DNA-directed RNA polymerase subunit delta [Mesoplasma lactucae ATCC 49193]ATZ20482.1 DNA directed RNA polymerase subunit delta [Mesoplasma lactucae ATCC 49193]MCL8216653.1 DNA-directed RNA polymerase subunit delta [Mesoplasma lactucae ATCC 49193]
MAKLSNVEVAYQFLQDKPNGADFNTVWNEVASNIHADNDDKSKLIADLYADMVLDNRFALTSDGKWALKSSQSLDDLKKKYDFVESFDFNTDFDDIEDDAKSDEDEDETEDEEDDEDESTMFVSDEDSYDDEDN